MSDENHIFKDPNAIIAEAAYRRGFMHGYSQAIDHVEDGDTIQDMLDYINKPLVEWRESRCDREVQPPPKI